MQPRQALQIHTLFSLLALGWLGWLWFGLGLALGGVFYQGLLLLGLAVIASGCAWYARRFRLTQGLFRRDTWKRLFVAILLLAPCSLILLSSPTVFSGRDQGSYSLAAVRLAQEHRLAFSTPASESFFKIYGPGRALNFPGFAYTSEGSVITQFPLGYVSWLGSAYALFGLSGLAAANAATLAIFLASFYLLLRLFVSKPFAWGGLAVAAFSFPTVWFSKFTLSENLAWALFMLLALQLTLFIRSRQPLFLIAVLSAGGFFVFTRIEGFAFLAVSMLILALSPSLRKLPSWKIALPVALVFAAFLVADLTVNLPFYKAVAKAVIGTWRPTEGGPSASLSDALLENLSLLNLFWIYGLLGTFIIGAFSVPILLKRRDYLALIPFALALPTLLYLVQPHISSDHPWILRRFAFSLWPAFLFSALIGIYRVQTFLARRYPGTPFFSKGYYAGALLAILLAVQAPAVFYYALFDENRGLLEQTRRLSESFSDDDLVLVSRLASGDAWSMLPDAMSALFGKQAAYFFNPEDLVRIDASRFRKIYLIVSQDELSQYPSLRDRLTPVRPYVISTTALEGTDDSRFPEKLDRTTNGFIFEIRP
jgi:hypothetical protein